MNIPTIITVIIVIACAIVGSVEIIRTWFLISQANVERTQDGSVDTKTWLKLIYALIVLTVVVLLAGATYTILNLPVGV